MTGVPRKNRLVVITAMAGISLLALTGCAPSSGVDEPFPDQAAGDLPDETVDAIGDAVEHAMEATGSSGAIAGVWAPWAGSSVSGYGTTEPGGDTKVSADMPFRIGGNTRPMTCSVLLSMADKGIVDLDDKVSTYLPTTVGVDGLTLEHLCTGASGLGKFRGNLEKIFVQNPERVWAPNELFNDGHATKSADSGSDFSSSATAYVLLGMALESATDKTFSQLYSRYVFDRLDMEDTSLPAPTTVKLPDTALHGYVAFSEKGKASCSGDDLFDESKLSSSMGYTSGGVVSTAEDMRRFAQAYATGSLVSDKSADVLEETRSVDDAPSWEEFGFGTYHLGPMRGQAGNIPGFLSASVSDPKTGLTVVVMLNNSTADSQVARDLAMQLASIGSKSPAAKDHKAPDLDLPWSAEQMVKDIDSKAVCQDGK